MTTLDPRERGKSPSFPDQQQEHPGTTEKLLPRPDHGEESYRGHRRLRDRVALMTGADSGIGRAVAIAFAREGADIGFSYLGPAERRNADDTRNWIDKAGRKALPIAVDISSPDDCRHLVARTVAAFGRIDILVNNAAYQGEAVKRFEELTAERVRHTFATNIEAMFNITREALPHMRKGGIIINTTSIQSARPSPGILDFAATKAAITSFTTGLAQYLVARGIRVNGVASGGPPAQPAELASAYVFLACEESRFVNGAILTVAGGKPFC